MESTGAVDNGKNVATPIALTLYIPLSASVSKSSKNILLRSIRKKKLSSLIKVVEIYTQRYAEAKEASEHSSIYTYRKGRRDDKRNYSFICADARVDTCVRAHI